MAHKPQKRKSPGFVRDGTSVDMADYQKTVVEEGVKEVAAWIKEVTGTNISSDVNEFFEAIQSGVLLATLIKNIAPQHAFKFKSNAKKDSFFARQNVEDFCTACKNLGVPEVSTFSSNDLTERQSDVRVVGCLKTLQDMYGDPPIMKRGGDAKMEDVEQSPAQQSQKAENVASSSGGQRQRKQQKTNDEKLYKFTITKRNLRLNDNDAKVSFPIEILKKPEERKHALEDDSVKEALEKDDNPFVKYMRKKSFISSVVLEEFQSYIKTKSERAKIKADDVCISLCKTDGGYILFFKPQPDWFFYYPVAKTSFQEMNEEKSNDEYRVVAVETV